MNVKSFVSPFYLNCIIVHLGLFVLLCGQCLGMMLSNHCQCENISEDGKENYVAHKLVYYIWIKKLFSLWS